MDQKRKADLRALFDSKLCHYRCFKAYSAGWMEATVQSVTDNQAVAKLQHDGGKVSHCLGRGTTNIADRKRLLKSALGQWTTRVVAVKSLELDVVEKRDKALLQ